MICTQKRFLVRCAALFAILLAPGLARAIGPQYQAIGDPVPAGASTLNMVVSLLVPNGTEDGTGSVIGVTAPDPNGRIIMSVLTARHVAIDGVTKAGFGVGPGEPGVPGTGAYPLTGSLATAFQGFTIVDPVNNPNNLPEDLAIMQLTVNKPAGGAALAEYNVIAAASSYLLKPFPVATPAPGSADAAASVPFTELGYGTAGTFNAAANTYQAISAQPDDARRFQNNTVQSVSAPSLVGYGPWYEPLVNWKYLAPSLAGGGASFPGDSGGPYLIGGTAKNVSVTPTFVDNSDPDNPLTPGTAVNVPVSFTDYLAAVHVSGAGVKLVGNGSSGVPLESNGSLDWATFWAGHPTTVPEPGSIALMVIGSLSLAFVARRNARRGARGQ